MKDYDSQYFIEKFTAIPDNRWIVGDFEDDEGNKCALGHCKDPVKSWSLEQAELNDIFLTRLGIHVAKVNDGITKNTKGFGKSPKERVLNALNKIKLLGF